MVREKDQNSFVHNFLVTDNIDFFLGSGASVSAGIPSGQNLIWHLKKKFIVLKIAFQENYLRTCNLNEIEANYRIILIH